MVEQIARSIAKADRIRFEDDPKRFCKLALAALKQVTRPTEPMVDVVHEAVLFDGCWAINSPADFKNAVRATI